MSRPVAVSGRSPRPDRREQILDAAGALVAEGGFAAASVRAVASRAGIGASTMRYWFPTQEALSAAVAQRMLSSQLDDARIDDASVPAAERLVECLDQFLPTAEGPEVGPRGPVTQAETWFALVASAVGPAVTPIGQALYAGMLDTSRARVEGWLQRLAHEGALSTAEVPVAVLALLTRIDGLVLGLVLPGSTLDLATARAILARDVEHLLAGAR